MNGSENVGVHQQEALFTTLISAENAALVHRLLFHFKYR